MSLLMVGIPAALAIFALLLWLLNPQRRRVDAAYSPLDGNVEKLLPLHYRYFPQVRQALSGSDEHYLRDRASAPVAHQALRERRAVARRFLAGLLKDFSNLERLARTIAALSPVISREQETERVMLGLKFRLLYALVWFRLSTGSIPVQNIEHLTSLVGKLATRMEQAMAAIGAVSTEGLTSGFRA
jgi:hypothetical protein